jgi:hypothetical protein
MQAFIAMLDRMQPGAGKLITASGPQVPVAFRMDDSALRSKIGEMPKTPLEEGVRTTLEMFRKLRRVA